MGLISFLGQKVGQTLANYVRNPNYDPNNTQSKRYVDLSTAEQEAFTRAKNLNDLYTLTGQTKQIVQPNTFYPPQIAPQTQPSDALRQLSVQLAQPTQKPAQQTVTPVVVPNATPTNTPQGDNLATLAAQAGLSVQDYLQLKQAQAVPTGEQIDKIRNDLNIPGLISDAFKRPDKTSVDLYKELYKQSGLNTIQDRIKSIDERLQQRRDDLVKATGELKNNPWLSQASRTGRLRILNELAGADINNILDEKQQYLDLYDQGVSEIENQIGLTLADQQSNRQLTVEELNFMLGEAERRTNVLEQNTTAEGLRNVPDFLRAQIAQNQSIATGGGSMVVTGNGDPSTLSALARQVYENPSLLSTLTPTEAGTIQKELANAGFTLERFTTQNLNAGQRDQLAQFDDLIRQGQEAEIILTSTGINTGLVASQFQKVGAALGFNQDFTDYRGVIDNMSSALLKLRSGAAVTPQEYERIKGFIPTPNDDQETAKVKIANFYSELEKSRQNFVLRGTQNVQDIRSSVGVGGAAQEYTAADQDYVNSLSGI